MKKNYLSLLIAALILSCQKDDVKVEEPITLRTALTAYTWNMYRLTLNFQDGSYTDLTNIYFKPCELDDLLKFNPPSLFTKSDGLNVCDPPGGSVFTNLNGGEWAVTDNDSMLYISKGFNAQAYKVSEWSRTKMKWKQSQTNYLGEKETYIFELMAK